jgi:hypothetical protein
MSAYTLPNVLDLDDDDKFGVVNGMRIGRGNVSTVYSRI